MSYPFPKDRSEESIIGTEESKTLRHLNKESKSSLPVCGASAVSDRTDVNMERERREKKEGFK